MPYNLQELEERYPTIYQLIGGYFHEDWVDVYGSAQAALDDYISVGGPEIQEAAGEIQSLLTTSDDDELAQILDRLHNSYHFEVDGYNARTWLQAILGRLRTAGGPASA